MVVRWFLEGEKLFDLVQLEVQDMLASRELELARQAGAMFTLEDSNAYMATGIVYAVADSVAARSRSLGTHRGLELWRHLYVQNKGVGPELSSFSELSLNSLPTIRLR